MMRVLCFQDDTFIIIDLFRHSPGATGLAKKPGAKLPCLESGLRKALPAPLAANRALRVPVMAAIIHEPDVG